MKRDLQSLPPRPTRATSSASTGPINFISNESHKSNNSSSCVESDIESNISYSSFSRAGNEVSSVDKKTLFLRSIQRRRNSLTNKEFLFLENLVHDGDEDELNAAMIKLSDKSLFFDTPSPKSQGILGSLRNVFACSNASNVNIDNSILQHTVDYSIIHQAEGREKKSQCNDSFDNIELVVDINYQQTSYINQTRRGLRS